MKTILFIGFRNKERLLQTSKANGYNFILLIDRKEYKPEFDDLFEEVIVLKNIFDWSQVQPALKNVSFDGVVTRYEDYTALLAAIADTFGLPSSGYENALKSRNKYLMRKAFKTHGVPSADFALIQKIEDARGIIERQGFPLILKQIAGIHSRYVFKIRSEKDLESKLNFLHEAMANDTSLLSENLQNYPADLNVPDPKKYFLLEEALRGEELTVDALICDGEIYTTPVCKYVTSEEIGFDDHHLPIRLMPYELSSEDEKLILSITRKALKSLELNYCATHTEVFFDPETKDCRLIEIASRAGGFRSEMFEASQGGDLDLAISQVSVRKKPDMQTQKKQFTAVVEIFSPYDGILENIDYEFLHEDEAVTNVTVNKDLGDGVGLAQNGGKYIVKFMLVKNSYKDCLSQAKKYLKQIHKSIQVA